ncbi:MAG: hypothetical protein CSH37_08735 [Thalassolituus sp.]|nr:MAG: hypothetical protein CSH37_08735 [Thalassolituus sp.]
MYNFDNLSGWLAGWLDDEGVEVEIHHMFGSDKYEFRINCEVVELNHLAIFSDPLCICQTAEKLIDDDSRDLEHPVLGRILAEHGSILFQFFPGNYGFSAKFSSLPDDKYDDLVGGSGFLEELKKVLGPGWHDAVEERFTKFELLRDKFKIRAQDTLEAVRELKNELVEQQSEGPRNAGSHLSDDFTWYQNGLDTCNLILKKYGR